MECSSQQKTKLNRVPTHARSFFIQWTERYANKRERKRNYHNNTSWNIVADGMNGPRGGIQYDNVARRTMHGICGEAIED